MRVLGVDGDKGGWVGVVLEYGRFAAAHLSPTLAELHAAVGPAEVIAIDMPIGLVDGTLREADRLARELLPGKGASIFNAPPASTWDLATYAEANRHAKEQYEKGLSKQSWALMPKIREATEFQEVVDAQVVEAHPELSFAQLAGMNAAPSKHTWDGLRERLARLGSVGLDGLMDEDVGAAGDSGIADLVDAAVVAHTAHRVGLGVAQCIPDPPEPAAIGPGMAIWF